MMTAHRSSEFLKKIFIFCLFLLDFASCLHQRTTTPWLHKDHNHDHDYDELTPVNHLPQLLTKGNVVRAVQGDNVTLPCEVIKLGKYSIVWHKEDTILWVLKGDPVEIQYVTKDPRFGRDNTSLVIQNASVDDEAVYWCEISSNQLQKIPTHLIISVPPSAWPTDRKGLVIDREGALVEFSCRVSGRPTPNVTWEREDGLELTGLPSFTTYTIANVTPSDAGRYFCVASNGIKEPAKAMFTLDVHYAPMVKAVHTTVHSGVNYDASIACVVDSSPSPKIDWLKEGAPVNPMRLSKGMERFNRYSLFFGSVIRKDFGFYSCNASNFYGNDSATIELTGRPLPPIVTSAPKGNFPDHYTITWEVKSYSPITNYVLLLRNLSDSEENWVNLTVPGILAPSMYHSQRYILRDLVQSDPLVAKIQAINEFGESEWSAPFEFQTFDPGEDILSSEENYLQEVPAEEFEASKFKLDLQPGISSAYDHEPPVVTFDDGSEEEAEETNFTDSGDFPPLLSSQRSSSNVSSGVHPTLTRMQKRAQMTAFLTAISLSAFFF